MSWLEARAYAPFDRANGMRLAPTIAARRGSEGRDDGAEGTIPPGVGLSVAGVSVAGGVRWAVTVLVTRAVPAGVTRKYQVPSVT
ncbi:hypothetical protein GCM10023203_21240 [Actinomycetospora straminea]|uniref:Uncharacterized protein n=1 Tax=Actinomycetospora straminea TaxID=663607 RepID=A0ABP9EDI0_9PSEU